MTEKLTPSEIETLLNQKILPVNIETQSESPKSNKQKITPRPYNPPKLKITPMPFKPKPKITPRPYKQNDEAFIKSTATENPGKSVVFGPQNKKIVGRIDISEQDKKQKIKG